MIPQITYTVIIVAILLAWTYTTIDREKGFAKERAEWQQERTDLLNRIQAGNYAEYKTQEIRVIKAQQGEDRKQIQIEPL